LHILVVTFQLDGISAEEFHDLCNELAATWAEIPGLISKIWLENAETNTYGGFYTWESQEAMDDFLQSELFRGIADNPAFRNATADSYGVIEQPTRTTRGLAAIPA
jgi:quinol monooxygenase YgiN